MVTHFATYRPVEDIHNCDRAHHFIMEPLPSILIIFLVDASGCYKLLEYSVLCRFSSYCFSKPTISSNVQGGAGTSYRRREAICLPVSVVRC